MSDHGHGEHGHGAHGQHAAEHHESHGGTGLYLAVTGALMVLTLGSFLTYWEGFRETVPLQARWLFMMAVAVTKACLVMLFFMHLKWEANWKYVLTIPSIIMAIFLMAALVPDVGLRTHHYASERKEHDAIPWSAYGDLGEAAHGEEHGGGHH